MASRVAWVDGAASGFRPPPGENVHARNCPPVPRGGAGAPSAAVLHARRGTGVGRSRLGRSGVRPVAFPAGRRRRGAERGILRGAHGPVESASGRYFRIRFIDYFEDRSSGRGAMRRGWRIR